MNQKKTDERVIPWDLEHGGDLKQFAALSGGSEKEITDFSANINPLGAPESLRAVLNAAMSDLVHYPSRDHSRLITAMQSKYGVSAEEVLLGNGSTEILFLLPRILKVKRAVIPVPSYSDYTKACALAGLEIEKLVLREENDFALDRTELESRLLGDEVVILGYPNNPTGTLFNRSEIVSLAEAHPDTWFVMDESFIDFVEGDLQHSFTAQRPANVVVLLSFTKIYAIPGLRLGAVIATPTTISRLVEQQPTWSVNSLALAVGESFLKDSSFLHQTRQVVTPQRERMAKELASIECLKVYPGQANFLLIRIEHPVWNATKLFSRLLSRGIAIRVCENFDGLDSRFFRIAIKSELDNQRLLDELQDILGSKPSSPVRKKTPAIMFQGIASNSGKSLLTAAFCRILLQDGFQPAPFKAQNMSLNSYVSLGGGELGRAQAVQAKACRIEPDVRMNPLLLKPNSNTGSQVILNGKAVGNMTVTQYVQYKPEAFEAVKASYNSLAAEFDVLVLEGAGSPAEINLKHHDIVNMRMAEVARAPVVLIGDIDRGGDG